MSPAHPGTPTRIPTYKQDKAGALVELHSIGVGELQHGLGVPRELPAVLIIQHLHSPLPRDHLPLGVQHDEGGDACKGERARLRVRKCWGGFQAQSLNSHRTPLRLAQGKRQLPSPLLASWSQCPPLQCGKWTTLPSFSHFVNIDKVVHSKNLAPGLGIQKQAINPQEIPKKTPLPPTGDQKPKQSCVKTQAHTAYLPACQCEGGGAWGRGCTQQGTAGCQGARDPTSISSPAAWRESVLGWRKK